MIPADLDAVVHQGRILLDATFASHPGLPDFLRGLKELPEKVRPLVVPTRAWAAIPVDLRPLVKKRLRGGEDASGGNGQGPAAREQHVRELGDLLKAQAAKASALVITNDRRLAWELDREDGYVKPVYFAFAATGRDENGQVVHWL